MTISRDDEQNSIPMSPLAKLALPDDIVLPFQLETASVNGRVARLGPAIDKILKSHDYPEPVSQVMGEALVLTALLGASIKFDGRLILQTKSDGPIDLMVIQYQTPGSLRGYARFDDAKVLDQMQQQAQPGQHDMLGTGHLAMTIDQGADMERYQGIVALEGKSLTDAAFNYFRQSEQLPSFIRLAVAKHYSATGNSEHSGWQWRAGGLIVQDLSREGGRQDVETFTDEMTDEALLHASEENWNRVNYLAETLEDHELLDPLLEPERLLYRLFHEERVRVFSSKPIKAECHCSESYIKSVLANFDTEELNDMREGNSDIITVTCEFCSTQYKFNIHDI